MGQQLLDETLKKCVKVLKSLTNNKNIQLPKLKTFVDDNLSGIHMVGGVFNRVGNIVGKGENAGYQHFLLFQQGFQTASSLKLLKLGIKL